MSYNVVEKTYVDLCTQIVFYQKCALIRPTGFGKTHLIARICQNKKNLIIVPSNSLASDIKRRYGEEFKLITYTKLMYMQKEGTSFYQSFGPLDYICLDEMHRAGAEKWYLAVEALLKEYPNVRLIGASATPVRCDGKDITEILFDNKQVFPYTIIEAMQDDILPRPIYVRALYDFEESSKEYLSLSLNQYQEKDITLRQLENEIQKKKIKMEQFLNIPKIIKTNIPDSIVLKNMKFIVFCSTIEEIETGCVLVSEWFSKAFPDKKVNLYSLHSKRAKQSNEINVSYFVEEKETTYIDLLFTVNMLNEGVHIDSISGLFFFRKTKSHIIYTQQLGRCLEKKITTPIVFDLVGNIENIGVIKESFNNAMGMIPKNMDTTYFDQYVYLKDYVVDIEKELNLLVKKLSLKTKVFTEEERLQILEMFHNQLPCKEIAIKMNRHPGSIYRFLRKNHLFYKKDPNLEDLISCYQQGMTIMELSKKFHYDKDKIRYLLNENGIKTFHAATKEEKKYILQLLKEEISIKEIQKITGRSKSFINEIKRKNQIQIGPLFPEKEIQQMYKEGIPLYQISKQLKINQKRATEYLEHIGLKERQKIIKITKENSKKIIHLYQEGTSIEKISKETNIGPDRIKKVLQENHVYQSPKRISEAEPALLKEMTDDFKKGSSYYALSKKYPYSNKTIEKFFIEKGITREDSMITVRSLSEEESKTILRLYQEGSPLSEICQIINTTSEQIMKVLKSHQIKIIPSQIKNADPKMLQAMISDYKNGFSIYMLAKKYPYSRFTINKYLEQNKEAFL